MTLITEEYRAQQQALHTRLDYGTASYRLADLWWPYVEQHRPKALLDYGAGKGRMAEALYARGWGGDYIPYDPAIPEWSDPPAPCEFVACIDVLEHIEPDCIDAVLDDLKRVTKGVGVYTVHLKLADKILPDGRNAHLIVKPIKWWADKIGRRVTIMEQHLINMLNRPEPDGVMFYVKSRR
jgi:hypothetical protein